MNEKQMNKNIENYIELRRLLWTTVIIITGGIITILLNLNPNSLLKVILVVVLTILGVGLDIIFISSIIEINQDLHKLIKKLGE